MHTSRGLSRETGQFVRVTPGSLSLERGILPQSEVVVLSPASISFRRHGLEFAQARMAHDPRNFESSEEIIFGVGPKLFASSSSGHWRGMGANATVFPWLGVEQYEFPRRVNVVLFGTREVWRGRKEDCPGLLAVVVCCCDCGDVRVGAEFGGWCDQRFCG